MDEKKLQKEYRKICKDFGERPFKGDSIKDSIESHLSMSQDFSDNLEDLLAKEESNQEGEKKKYFESDAITKAVKRAGDG